VPPEPLFNDNELNSSSKVKLKFAGGAIAALLFASDARDPDDHEGAVSPLARNSHNPSAGLRIGILNPKAFFRGITASDLPCLGSYAQIITELLMNDAKWIESSPRSLGITDHRRTAWFFIRYFSTTGLLYYATVQP
jgi:hypothetical protein